METTIRTAQFKRSHGSKKTATKSKTKSLFWKQVEHNRFSVSPLILLVMCIMAGIAAAYGIVDSTFQLMLVVFPATISLALILSLAPMKAIVYCSVITILIDILVILF